MLFFFFLRITIADLFALISELDHSISLPCKCSLLFCILYRNVSKAEENPSVLSQERLESGTGSSLVHLSLEDYADILPYFLVFITSGVIT